MVTAPNIAKIIDEKLAKYWELIALTGWTPDLDDFKNTTAIDKAIVDLEAVAAEQEKDDEGA